MESLENVDNLFGIMNINVIIRKTKFTLKSKKNLNAH